MSSILTTHVGSLPRSKELSELLFKKGKGESFDINLFDFVTLLTVYTSSIMLGVISFLPLGIGVVEGSLAGFMSYQGLEISSALTLVVIIRLIVQWLPITAGFISLKIIK